MLGKGFKKLRVVCLCKCNGQTSEKQMTGMVRERVHGQQQHRGSTPRQRRQRAGLYDGIGGSQGACSTAVLQQYYAEQSEAQQKRYGEAAICFHHAVWIPRKGRCACLLMI